MLGRTIGIGAEAPEIDAVRSQRLDQFSPRRCQGLVELAVAEHDPPCPKRRLADGREIGR
ncbi:hypothetical protein D3C87_2021990 [compost metagenome]